MASRETTAKPSSAAASSSSQETGNPGMGACKLETQIFTSSRNAAASGQQSSSSEAPVTRKRPVTTTVDSSAEDSSAVEGSPRKRARLSTDEVKDKKESPLSFLAAPVVTPTKKNKTKTNKKKKKKFSSILKNMLQTNTQTRNLRDEREALRKGLGGGNFEKVAKI